MSRLYKLVLQNTSSQVEVMVLLTTVPSLPVYFYITPLLIYKNDSLWRQLARFSTFPRLAINVG